MDALWASYASSSSSSSDEEEDNEHNAAKHSVVAKKPKIDFIQSPSKAKVDTAHTYKPQDTASQPESATLPPPPPEILNFHNDSGSKSRDVGNRLRSFPHVEGNYALHVYIPVTLLSNIKKMLVPMIAKAGVLVPELFAIDTDLPLSSCYLNSRNPVCVESPMLNKQFHISLSRTVAIRVHQIDTIVEMLRHRLYNQKRYLIEFGTWEVFINDEKTRSFLSMEVTNGGLQEISKQVHIVDEVYRLHNLPEFYKNPRPHISVAWALGDITSKLQQVAEELNRSTGSASSTKKCRWAFTFNGIECKIGQRIYSIVK